MPWRERIAVAQQHKRGIFGWCRAGFSQQDYDDAWSIYRCAAHEVLTACGLRERYGLAALGDDEKGTPLFQAFPSAVFWDRPSDAGRILDLMEDRALQLKREMRHDGAV